MNSNLHRYCYNIIYLLFNIIKILFKKIYIHRNENVNYLIVVHIRLNDLSTIH